MSRTVGHNNARQNQLIGTNTDNFYIPCRLSAKGSRLPSLACGIDPCLGETLPRSGQSFHVVLVIGVQGRLVWSDHKTPVLIL